MAQVAPNLFVGGWRAARESKQFDIIINCAVDAPHCGHIHFKLVDGPGNDPKEMALAIVSVIDSLKRGQRTLVHCVAGRSRSLVVAAKALSVLNGTDFDKEIKRMQPLRQCEGPNQPHPSLVEMARAAL